MSSCTFNDQRSGACDAHNLDWSLLFMGGALTLLGMGHRGLGGAIARNLGTIALGTGAVSLLKEGSWTAAAEQEWPTRRESPPRIHEPHPTSLKDAVDVAGYESFPASDPPAIH